MTEHRNSFALTRTYCLAALLFTLSLPPVFQEPDLYLYASLRNHYGADGFVDPPKNRYGFLYYYGDDPEVEVILANETGKEIIVQWITTNMVTPIFVKAPGGKWKRELQFRQLNEHPVLKSGQRRSDVRTTRATLQLGDTVSVGFKIVTETGDKPPPGDYEIEVNCRVSVVGLKREWVFHNRLEFEIREPKTLGERVSFLSLRARRYLDEQNYTAAEETINRALQLYPLHSAGYSILAYSKQSQGQYAEAIRYYESAIELLETRQDYLGTRGRSDASIEDEIGIMKATIRSLQAGMRRQPQKR